MKNRVLLACLVVVDAFLSLARSRQPVAIPRHPRRVLLALGGQLGDAVIATATIQYLHDALPEVEIGMVLPSWSRPVLDGDSRLRWIHTVDHWKPNRSGETLWTRWQRYRASRRVAVHDIREIGYDVAIDLYGYFPNMATVLWQAAIPIRLGFRSGGFGPLYTHSLAWTDDQRHIAQRQVELVRLLTPDLMPDQDLRYSLPRTSRDALIAEQGAALLATAQLAAGEYVLVHMGSGSKKRQWPAAQWAGVLAPLSQNGHHLVFTGRGEHEAASILIATKELPRTTNLCDRLSWDEFVQLVRQARLVITVETAAAHVAAATGTPCVAVWSGTTSPDHWGPLGTSVALVSGAVPDAPGCRSRDSGEMRTMTQFPAREVLQMARRLLATAPHIPAPSARSQAPAAR